MSGRAWEAQSESTSEPAEDDLALRFYPVTSADGTRLQAWTNDVAGPTVLLCNGLGTNPYAWPELLRPDCGVRVISWNHRGVGGSERPADPDRVGMDAFVEDALAVLDDAGVESCVVAGWSIGVNTAFELAITEPARVTGLFAVAGVPGGTFSSMGAPLLLPRPVRKPIALGVTRVLRRSGRALTPVTSRLPVWPSMVQLLTHSGLMLPSPDGEHVQRAIKEFIQTPVDWYMHLARAAARHPRVSLRYITVPTTFVAGRYDLLASAADMATAAERIPSAEYVVLRGTHFIQLEHPDEVHRHLLDLLARVRSTM
jgi:pimeloyl-ACP methyl ester carboxylesterase